MEDSNRLYDKIDKIEEHLNSMDKTLVQQHEILKDHTRRSLANEEAVKVLKEELKPVLFQYYIIKFLCALLGSGLIIEIIRLLSDRTK